MRDAERGVASVGMLLGVAVLYIGHADGCRASALGVAALGGGLATVARHHLGVLPGDSQRRHGGARSHAQPPRVLGAPGLGTRALVLAQPAVHEHGAIGRRVRVETAGRPQNCEDRGRGAGARDGDARPVR